MISVEETHNISRYQRINVFSWGIFETVLARGVIQGEAGYDIIKHRLSPLADIRGRDDSDNNFKPWMTGFLINCIQSCLLHIGQFRTLGLTVLATFGRFD